MIGLLQRVSSASIDVDGERPEDMRRMGQNARRIYEEKYTPKTNYRQLMAIYEEAIEEN